MLATGFRVVGVCLSFGSVDFTRRLCYYFLRFAR